MKVILLLLFIEWISGEIDFSSDRTLELINGIEYSHQSTYSEDQAEFTFTIANTTYLHRELNITAYLFAITYLVGEAHENRTGIEELPENEKLYLGTLKMEGLEEHSGSFFICVFFLSDNLTNVITSSRFCHVISTSDSCDLEPHESTFSVQLVLVLIGCVLVFLTVTILFTCIRAYVYRARTAEQLLAAMSQDRADGLRTLADEVQGRRTGRRSTQKEFIEQYRKHSGATVEPYSRDPDYSWYHGHTNPGLEPVEETDN